MFWYESSGINWTESDQAGLGAAKKANISRSKSLSKRMLLHGAVHLNWKCLSAPESFMGFELEILEEHSSAENP